MANETQLLNNSLKTLCNKFTEVVARQLHVMETTDYFATQPRSLLEFCKQEDGWHSHYRDDPRFKARVDSLVARLMSVIEDTNAGINHKRDGTYYR